MQCFRVGYRGVCHGSLLFSAYTRALGIEKALHNCFYPMPKFMKTFGRAGESPEIPENFGKASNPFLRSLNKL